MQAVLQRGGRRNKSERINKKTKGEDAGEKKNAKIAASDAWSRTLASRRKTSVSGISYSEVEGGKGRNGEKASA